MVPSSPALPVARALARLTGATLLPVGAEVPDRADSAIVLHRGPLSEERLAALAALLSDSTALALFVPGWDEAAAVGALGRHGIEHGTVAPVTDPEAGVLCVLSDTAEGAERIAEAFARPVRPFRTLAIMPAYNESDVIHHSIGALVAEGVDVYLLDHESTDGTAEAAAPWLGHGLLHIERFPGDAGYPAQNETEMVWRDILRRVEDVSREVPADWYIFTNADEFREAPWPGVSLLEGLQEVDELGFSAVDFSLFDFRPVDDSFVPGEDPRRFLRFYEAGGRYDSMQVKAWKRQSGPVDIVSHGGHDVLFPGKRLFPIPFILRHYPIRSSAHGARKVLAERLPRFSAQERADGWHVQYDSYAAGREFLHDPATLLAWNGDAARAELLGGAARSLLLSMCVAGADPAATDVAPEPLGLWLARRGSAAPQASLPGAQQRLTAAAQGTVLVPHAELDAVARDLALALEAHARTRGELVQAQALSAARAALPSA